MTSESKIEKKAVRLIWRKLGIKGLKLRIIGETGFPDRLFLLPGGKPVFIEFKAPGEKARPKQIKIHNDLKELGYIVKVIDNEIDALQAITEALGPTRLSKESR